MFGHGCPLVEPDFCVGVGVGVELVGAAVVVEDVGLVVDTQDHRPRRGRAAWRRHRREPGWGRPGL